MPTPSVTKIVWPLGCVCHAVRAPGVKWTLLAVNRDPPIAAATVSMYTSPVNHSFGPFEVLRLFLVMCMALLLRRLPELHQGLRWRPGSHRPCLTSDLPDQESRAGFFRAFRTHPLSIDSCLG